MPLPLRVILYAEAPPRTAIRLISRLKKEVTGIELCGLAYRPKPGAGPGDTSAAAAFLSACGDFLLRLVHACPPHPNGEEPLRPADLSHWCETRGIPFQLISDTQWDTPEAEEFCRRAKPDLGIVCADDLHAGRLLDVPRFGSIRARTGWRGGKDRAELKITLYHESSRGSARLASYQELLAVEAYDTLTSLRLKSMLLEMDLLVQCAADVAGGASIKATTETTGADEEHAERAWEEYSRRSPYHTPRGRPGWKLLLRTVLFGPYILGRNWVRRLRGRFPVVILYHHLVSDRPHRMGIPTELFLKHVNFLKRHYRIASLAEAIQMLKAGKVEAPTAVLTFDDGYADNFMHLRAVTEAAGIPAVLFVCTDPVAKQTEFEHDLKKGQRGFPALTWEQIRRLRGAGFEIGSHTRSHFDCGSSDAEKLESEIVGSRRDLEEHLGSPVLFFSFPWGNPANMSAPAVQLARDAYPHILSACGGENAPARNETFWHLRRRCHPNDLWELELTLQGALEFERGAPMDETDRSFA